VEDARTSFVAFCGIGESLNNVAFALLFVTVGAIALTLGAWKIARQTPSLGTPVA
jgi:hypothetical protein